MTDRPTPPFTDGARLEIHFGPRRECCQCRTTWTRLADAKPSKSAPYLIFAPSADPEKPLIHVAWFDPDEDQWSGLVECWLRAITHWMPLPEPPETSQ